MLETFRTEAIKVASKPGSVDVRARPLAKAKAPLPSGQMCLTGSHPGGPPNAGEAAGGRRTGQPIALDRRASPCSSSPS